MKAIRWDFAHILLGIAMVLLMVAVTDLKDANRKLAAEIQFTTHDLLWTTAQRDMLQDHYLTGEMRETTIEEWLVKIEYEREKGTEDRSWALSKIVEAIHLLTSDRYRDTNTTWYFASSTA